MEESTATSVDHRTMMWGRIGQIFADTPRTAEQAIQEAGLDWDVELRDLGFKSVSGNHFIKAPGNFVTVRTDTEQPLGTVKSRYVPFSNRAAFAFADHLVDGAGASFESAWSMLNGKVVGLTMKLPATVTVGGDDSFGSYLMLRTSHDGSSAIKLAVSTVRMACLNQFNVTLRSAKRAWSIHHTRRASEQVQQAREALELAFAYDEAFEQAMEKLLATPITTERAKPLITSTLRSQRVSEETADKVTSLILGNLEHSATIPDDQRNTAYGLLNASTEYFDHIRTYRDPMAAFKVTTEGLGARVNQALTNQLVGAR